MLNHPAALLLIAFVLDLLIGDPPCPVHPVRLIGKLIRFSEKQLRSWKLNLLLAGALLPLIVSAGTLLAYQILLKLSGDVTWIVNLTLIYSLLALKDLVRHATAVKKELELEDLPQARAAVQMLVGRNTNLLDESGVARAAIESVAENFVDGFLSPVFWFATGSLIFHNTEGGVCLLLIFKVISTLDSMVGYKNESYLLLGRVSAKLDDGMNYIPARLSLLLIAVCSGKPRETWRIGLRDRLKHTSPNSAHAEAAVAGALGLRLGGPTAYPHGIVEKPWLGDGSADATAVDLQKAVRLILICGLAGVLVAATALLQDSGAACLRAPCTLHSHTALRSSPLRAQTLVAAPLPWTLDFFSCAK